MKKRILLFVAMMFCAVSVFAQKKILDSQLTIYMLDNVTSTAVVTGNLAKQTVETIDIHETITSDGVTYSVTSIGDNAFKEYSSLTSVTIPNSVKSIGEYAFYGCDLLISVTISNSVTSIGDYAFADTRLASVTIPNSVKSIGEYAFYGCGLLTSVTIPNSVTSIGKYAFCCCGELTSVTIPNSVTSIGQDAFSQCYKLASVTIPNSVKSIGDYAFYKTALTSVTIPNSVTSIGWDAFSNCTSLASVTIPNSVTSIGSKAFYECTGITDVYCYADPDNLTWTGSGEDFQSGGATKFHVPSEYLEKWKTNFQNAVNVTFDDVFPLDDDNADFRGITYTLYNGSHTARVSGHTDALKSEITIPSTISSNGVTYSVTSISSSAFLNCTSLTSVTIPNSVTSIGHYAFQHCSSLTSVTIPNSVTSIGEFAFEDCTSLTSVTIPNSITSIGYGVFMYCTRLTSVTIPNSVKSIGHYAFGHCSSLTSVTIPNSVTSIGERAFYYCSSLASVTIERGDLSNLVLGEYVFLRVASNCDIELKYTGTLHDGFSVAFDITDGTGISIDDNKMDFTSQTSGATLTTKEVSGALSITKTDGEYIATIDGNSSSSISIAEDINVASVTYNRKFVNDGGAYTIMLPFAIDASSAKGTFHTLLSIESDKNNPSIGIAKMSNDVEKAEANTPYIFTPSENFAEFDEMTFSDVTLEKTTSALLTNDCANSNWKLHGVYAPKVWTDADVNDYGFAAAKQGDIAVGEFVHFVTGASLKATRCYLEYSKDGFSKSSPVLPERIIVVFPDETASTVEPGNPDDPDEITTPTAEIAPNSGINVWSADGSVIIEAQPDMDYTIVDLSGRTLKNGVTHSTRETVTLSRRAAGIVIVKIGNKTFKVQY